MNKKTFQWIFYKERSSRSFPRSSFQKTKRDDFRVTRKQRRKDTQRHVISFDGCVNILPPCPPFISRRTFFFTTDEKHLIVYFQLRSKSLDKTTWLECQLAHIFLFVHKSLHDFDLIWKVREWEEEELNLILMELERTRVHLIGFLCMHGIPMKNWQQLSSRTPSRRS